MVCGQFKRMVGLVKQCLYKATGRDKLKQLTADVYRRRYSISGMTPNIIIHGQPTTISEEQFDDDDKVIKKRQRNIKRCGTKSTRILLEKDSIRKTIKDIWK